MHYLIPVLLLILALGSSFGAVHYYTTEYQQPTERMDALVCWHEFQSGRRATTADCPEL